MSLGIRLTWKRSNDDTVEYGIWRRTYDTEAHEIARIAQTAAGENPFFEDMDVDIKPPIGPDGLTIECPTDSTVCLKWAEAADPANPTYYYSIRSLYRRWGPFAFLSRGITSAAKCYPLLRVGSTR